MVKWFSPSGDLGITVNLELVSAASILSNLYCVFILCGDQEKPDHQRIFEENSLERTIILVIIGTYFSKNTTGILLKRASVVAN